MRALRRWGPVVAWMAVIYLLSAQSQFPQPEQRWLDFVLEKSAHIIEFAVLGILLLRALEPQGARDRRFTGAAVLLAWLYALSDEYHQAFVPGRAADWTDIAADWTGALVATWLWSYVRSTRHGPTVSKKT